MIRPPAERSAPAAFLAGAVAATGHAPFGLLPLSLAGFAALAWLMAAQMPPGRAMVRAWFAGLGYFIVAMHWIVEPFLVDVARHGWMAPFALVGMTGGLALFWAAAGWLTGWLGGGSGRRVFVWALALSAAELARGYVLTGLPWALPAYVWADWPARLAAAWIGPYGLNVVTLLLAASLAAVALPGARLRAALGGAAVALVLAGAALAPQPDPVPGAGGAVRIVQPNAPQDEKWDPVKAHEFVARQIVSTAAAKGDVRLIVWPETALPYRLDTADPVLAQIAGAAEGVPVILGINRVEEGRFYNALIAVGPDGQAGQVYDKVRLVPFGEFIPLGQLARLVGLQSFAARDGYGFSAGKGVRLLDTPLGRALPLICYEAVFPQHPRAAGERPDLMVQITNDAWFGTFSGPYQHLDQARFRAVEQGLPMVRAANTGVSAVIDATGRVIGEIPLGTDGFLDVALPPALPPTVYARTGDLPVAAFLLLTLCGLALGRPRNAIAKRDRV